MQKSFRWIETDSFLLNNSRVLIREVLRAKVWNWHLLHREEALADTPELPE